MAGVATFVYTNIQERCALSFSRHKFLVVLALALLIVILVVKSLLSVGEVSHSLALAATGFHHSIIDTAKA